MDKSKCRRTGNVCIEYAQSGEASGVAVCEADLGHQLNDDNGKPRRYWRSRWSG